MGSTPLAGERLRPLGHLSGETLDKENRTDNQYGIRISMLYYREIPHRGQRRAPMSPVARRVVRESNKGSARRFIPDSPRFVSQTQ
ncbi:protein of unknown function [Nitratireductor aquimarinus]